MVAPLPPHYMHRAERRSMSLEASVPQRMIHGASAVGTRCTQRAQIISEGGDGCRGLPAHERRMGLFAPTGKPPRLVAPLAISLAPGRRLDLAPVATLAGAVGSRCRRYCGGNYLIALSGNIQRIALCGEVKRLSELSVQRAPSIDLA